MNLSLRPGAWMLFCASLIWGLAFIPQSLTVAHQSGFWACALRFALAAPLALLLAKGRLKSGLSLPVSLLLGVLLYGAFWAQTEALRHTPVARVSLISGLYAVFTPLLAPLLGLPRPARRQIGGALLAFCGLFALTGNLSTSQTPWNVGDALSLLHAFISAIHILMIGKLAPQSEALSLNAVQIGIVACLALPVAWFWGGPVDLGQIDAQTWWAFGYLALFSSVIAFALQLTGQKRASPSLCAVIFLLESPIGATAAIFLLGESLAMPQMAGALILMSGIGLSLHAETQRHHNGFA